MSEILIAGDDPDGVGPALEAAGGTASYVAGTADRSALEAAGVADADALVVTDAGLATSVTVALDCNPDLRIVIYTRDSVPEFVKGQAGHIVDPELLDPDTVAEELLRDG
jgi:Trk K+ transport system NAD-binding subunit